MTAMKRQFALYLAVVVFAFLAAGCCNTHYKVKQTEDNVHTVFLDGDWEQLPEAEPDSAA